LRSKKQSFGNNSGKPQAIRTKFGTHAQVEGRQRPEDIFGAIGQAGAKWMASAIPAQTGFFDDVSATSQEPNFTKFGHDT